MGCLKLHIRRDDVVRINACLVLLFLHSHCMDVCYFGGRQGRRVDSHCHVMYDLRLTFPEAVKFCKRRNGSLTQVLGPQLDLALAKAWRTQTQTTPFVSQGVWLGGTWRDGSRREESTGRKPIHHDVTGNGDTTRSDDLSQFGLDNFTVAPGQRKSAYSRQGKNNIPDGHSEGMWAWLDGGQFRFQNFAESGQVLRPANARCVTKLLRPPYSWRPTKCGTPSYVCCQFPACPPGHFGADGCRRSCFKCGAHGCDVLSGECIRRDHPVPDQPTVTTTHIQQTPRYPTVSSKHPTPSYRPEPHKHPTTPSDLLTGARQRSHFVNRFSQTWKRRNDLRRVRTNTRDVAVTSQPLPLDESRSKRSTCAHGFFGPNCKERCHCFRNKPCERELGTCPKGNCTWGWSKPQCSKSVCSPGTYGLGCMQQCKCGNSSSDRGCHPVSGACDDEDCSSDASTFSAVCTPDSCPTRARYANCTKGCNCWGSLVCHPRTGYCPYFACKDYLNEASPTCTPEIRDASLWFYLSLSVLIILFLLKVFMDLAFNNWQVKIEIEGVSQHT